MEPHITKSQYLIEKYEPYISTFICVMERLDILPPELIQLIVDAYIHIDKDWDEVMYWKKIFSANQDTDLKQYKSNPSTKLNTKFYETSILDCAVDLVSRQDRYFRCNFVFPKSHLNKYVYKNLRLTCDTHNIYIEDCEIDWRGYCVDKINLEMFQTLRHLYKIVDDTILPFSFCRDGEYFMPSSAEIQARIMFKPGHKDLSNFKLLVDIYEITDTNFDSANFICNNVATRQIFTGGENRDIGQLCKYKLNFSNVINYIIIHLSNDTLKNFNLRFNGINTSFDMSNIIKYDNKYIIPFTKSLDITHYDDYGINFSKIDNPYLTLDIDGEVDSIVNIFAISYGDITITPTDLQIKYGW